MKEKNDTKNSQKSIYLAKVILRYFENMLDMSVMFLGGQNTSHGLTLKLLPDPQPTQRPKPPHLESTIAFFCVF